MRRRGSDARARVVCSTASCLTRYVPAPPLALSFCGHLLLLICGPQVFRVLPSDEFILDKAPTDFFRGARNVCIR